MDFKTSDSHRFSFSKEALAHCQTIQRMLDITSNQMVVSLPFTLDQLSDAHKVLLYGSYGDMPLRSLYNILPVLDYMECPVHLKSVSEHISRQIDDYRTTLELNTNNINVVSQKMLQYLATTFDLK